MSEWRAGPPGATRIHESPQQTLSSTSATSPRRLSASTQGNPVTPSRSPIRRRKAHPARARDRHIPTALPTKIGGPTTARLDLRNLPVVKGGPRAGFRRLVVADVIVSRNLQSAAIVDDGERRDSVSTFRSITRRGEMLYQRHVPGAFSSHYQFTNGGFAPVVGS